MKKQLNFVKLFYEHFGDTPNKVTYEVRQDSNRFHDLVFLNSLIHDARFKRESLRHRGKRLSIPIERDCWELHVQHSETSGELYIAQAQLVISPVVSIEWQFKHSVTWSEENFSPKDELWIQDIWIDRQSTQDDDNMPIIINGFTWQCNLTVLEPDLRIRLQDLECPYLHSRKAKKKNKI